MLQPHYPRWRRRLKLIISVMFIILSLSVCAGIQLFIGIFLFDYGADGQAVGPEHMLGGGGGGATSSHTISTLVSSFSIASCDVSSNVCEETLRGGPGQSQLRLVV